MYTFKNPKLQALYLALLDLYGEDKVGYQDSEDNDFILLNTQIVDEYNEDTMRFTVWFNAERTEAIGSMVAPGEEAWYIY